MPNRILVLRLSSLGDVALTGPVYRNLKAHWPDCTITVLVKPAFRAVLASNPFVDEVLAYHGLRESLRDIRSRRFTHLLDLHATWRTFWLRAFSGITNVVVYRKDALARRLYVLFRWASPTLVKHSLDRYLESLEHWGVPVVYRDLRLGDYASANSAARGAPAPASRVILMQTSFLGDTLLTVPLARKIKELLPGCRLSVLTRPETAAIFRRCPDVDEVLEDDKRRTNSGLGGLLALGRDLRARNFDLALVAHRSLRSALAAWLAGIPHRIGFASSAGWFLFHQTVHFSWGMPELERNLALLLPLKPDLKAQAGDSLYLAKGRGDPAASISERLAQAGVRAGDRLVGLHPGSIWPTKRWLPERFARLCARLVRETGVKVVLIGARLDRELCGRIRAESGVDALDWSGSTTLEELLQLASRLDLLVTNDSGPMHVAAANGVPTLAIFGPTTKELGFFPYGAGHRVLEVDLACRPCGLHGRAVCPEGHFLCMRLIGADRVFEEARRMLGSSTRAGGAPGAAR